MQKDLYSILGVDKSASVDEIKRSYRKLAAKYHPDVNKDPNAVEKFKEVQEAWEVLSDPQKKSQYDQFGSVGGGSGFGGGDYSDFTSGFQGDLGDIFESFFGGGGGAKSRQSSRSGRDIQLETAISLQEAFSGKKYETTIETMESCGDCNATGLKKGTGYKTCGVCQGSGKINRQQRTPFGVVQMSSTCSACSGQGRIPESPCTSCNGTGRRRAKKSIVVDIPAGIFDGALLRISGKGEAGEKGASNGDFLLRVHVYDDKKFRRDKDNIHSEITISAIEAILGNEVEVETLHGKIKIKIPSGTQPNTKMKIRSKGMPVLQRNSFGDHLVHVKIKIPNKISNEEKKLYSELAKLSKISINNEKSFFDGLFS